MREIGYEMPTRKDFQNLSGQVFGRLTVLEWNHKKGNRSYYLCRCECGENIVAEGKHLKSGRTKSCGCYLKEWNTETKTKHGLKNHPLYPRCSMIMMRCYDENHKEFHNYGGREHSDPIYVQESWRNDIGLMIRDIEAEIGLPPFKGAQIDRDNNDLGYESGNIRWVTVEENARNKRETHNHARNPVTRKATPTYIVWRDMIRKYYSEVCIEWIHDGNCETTNGFRKFLSDMGEKPYLGYRKRTPLMRYDETKPWCRENCYWKLT